MTTTTSNGITLDYEIQGPDDGEPVLLIMGLGAQLVVWPQGFVDRLSDAGYRVIRFDNRDVGRSSRIDAPMPTLGQMAAAFVAPRRANPAYTLQDMADELTVNLPYGRKRALEIATTLAMEPELMLLDDQRQPILVLSSRANA